MRTTRPVEKTTIHEPAPSVGTGVVAIKARTIWLAAGVVVALVVVGVVLTRALSALLLLFIAIVLAEGIRPIVGRMSKGPLPRAANVLLLYVLFIGGVLLLGWILVEPLVRQALAFVNDLPRYIGEVQRVIAHVQHLVRNNPQAASLLSLLSSQAQRFAQGLVPVVLRLPLLLLDTLFKLLQILLFTFFWLTAADHLKGFVVGLLPTQAQETASSTIAEMSVQLGGYLRGVIINMTVIGVLSGGGLYLLGVPYPVLLGVLAALAESLPFIGPWISGTPAVLLAFASGGLLKAVETLVLYQAIQLIEGNALVPLVMNRTVHLNPLTVTIAIVVGVAVLGLVGAVLAVPLAVLLQVLVLRVLAPLARRASARVSAQPGATVHAGRPRL